MATTRTDIIIGLVGVIAALSAAISGYGVSQVDAVEDKLDRISAEVAEVKTTNATIKVTAFDMKTDLQIVSQWVDYLRREAENRDKDPGKILDALSIQYADLGTLVFLDGRVCAFPRSTPDAESPLVRAGFSQLSIRPGIQAWCQKQS